jgi:hypothetical protein
VNILDELKTWISAATADVTNDKLQHTWQGVNYRWDVYRATDGAHYEIFHSQQLFHVHIKKLFQLMMQTTPSYLFSFLSYKYLKPSILFDRP